MARRRGMLLVPNPATAITPALKAVSNGTSEIDLTILPGDRTDIKSYRFDFAPTPNGPWSTLSVGTSPLLAHNGLTAGTTFYYRAQIIYSTNRTSNFSPIVLCATPGSMSGAALSASIASGNLTTSSGSQTGTPARIHPGHRFWLNNPYYPGNQQGEIAAACSTISANQFNGLGIIMTWADISDPTLTGGAQTFNIFRTNLQDVLTRVKNAQAASSQPNKKIYITLKWWQGTFYPSYFGTVASVSGTVVTIAAGVSLPSGIRMVYIGKTLYSVSSNTSTTMTLTTAPGNQAGVAFTAGRATASDGSLWPTWLSNKGNWVKAFIQPNGNSRGQLAYDLPEVWAATQEMFAGMAGVINSLDTDNRIDIVAVGDETVCATVDIAGNGICNGANYDAQLTALMKSVRTSIPDRTIWVPFNYSGENNDAVATQTIFSALQAYSRTFGYGGPDSPTFGTHGNVNAWYTTFLNVITGLSGTLGDVRDTVLRIGNTEGPGLLGAGSGYASKPTLTLQQGFDDMMTRKSIPANGSIGVHQGLGCSVMHWDYQTGMYYKTSDIVTCVNANSGFFTPLPPGNWNTN